MEGYFAINRQIFESWVFADEKTFKIWVWLIGKARHKTGFVNIAIGRGGKSIELKRGQLIFGRFKAEESLNLNGSLIYRRMQKMAEEGMILIESNSHYTIVTICKYDDYQTQNKESEQPLNSKRTAIEQPLNSHCTTNEQQMNTNKNDNNDNKEKNVNKENNNFNIISEKISDDTNNQNDIFDFSKKRLIDIDALDLPIALQEYFNIAFSFYQLFEKNLIEIGTSTTTLEKAKGTWINETKLLFEKDKKTKDECREIFNYLGSPRGNFWKPNIQSIKKLREKFDTLIGQAKLPTNPKHLTQEQNDRKIQDYLDSFDRKQAARNATM